MKKVMVLIMCIMNCTDWCMEPGFESSWALMDHVERFNQEAPLTPLHVACATGDIDYVETYIKKYVNTELAHYSEINNLGRYDRETVATPLFLASQYGHTNIVALLLKEVSDIKINKPEYFNARKTPLHVAANKKIAELLIQHGADVNAAPSILQITPLITHTIKQNKDIVEVLIEAEDICLLWEKN